MFLRKIAKTLLWALCFSVLLATAYILVFWGRIYPGVEVAGISLSGKKPNAAAKSLESQAPPNLVLRSENPKIEIQLDSLEIKYSTQDSAREAFFFGRTGNHKQKIQAKAGALTHKINLPFVFKISQTGLDKALELAQDSINVPPTEPSVFIEKGKVLVNTGKDGIEVKKSELSSRILDAIAYNRGGSIQIPTEITKARLTDLEAELIRARAEKLIGKSLKASVEYQLFVYSPSELVSLVAPEGTKEEKINSVVFDIAKAVNRPPQDARLVFEDGRVKEFAPGKDGLETDQRALKLKLQVAIETLIVGEEKTFGVEIPVAKTKPQVATGDVNNLGIKELIGRGTSLFHGSILGRIHNVALAAGKINGLLIKPGETFSFNKALGDVSEFTGFKQAYIIKDGKTILGDGGGVCQVSTTLFRAALNTGLPIAERRAHSYRVGYYEQDSKPGIDATVFDPTTDFKIRNDTPGHILIQAIFNRKNLSLVFELYGSSDGRVATITTPRVWDTVPAPPPLYQEDPTLPPGTKKQVDWAAQGAKTAFDYKVTRNGETLQERTFYSNFRPWQAVYLVAPGTAQQ